jgi:transposase
MRRDLATKIRGLLKTFGSLVGKVGERAYEYRVRQLVAGEPELEPAVHALLAVRDLIDRQIAALETRILAFARRSDACRRLMTILGVEALTAVAFVATIEPPTAVRALVGRGRVSRSDTAPLPSPSGPP